MAEQTPLSAAAGAAGAPAPAGRGPEPAVSPRTGDAGDAGEAAARREPAAAGDDSTFALLGRRLAAAAGTLTQRAEALDAARTDAFGTGRTEPAGAARLRTARPAVVVDLAHVGGHVLAASRPAAASSSASEDATRTGDVLSLHALREGALEPVDAAAVPGLLDDPRLHADVAELYRYYRHARPVRLRRTATLLLAVFRTGERERDVRVLRWRLDPDGTVRYLDARGEREHLREGPGGLSWTEVGREAETAGAGGEEPRLAVTDTLLLSVSGGHLTVRDAVSGAVWFREPVEQPLQSPADAEVARALAGPLAVLRVLPYRESVRRHVVVNRRTGEAVRLDGVGAACVPLPDDAGLVFPGGCYLAAAPAGSAARTFGAAGAPAGAVHTGTVRSPSGEDVLYVWREEDTGRCVLVPYNVLRAEPAAPLTARGHALLPDGTLALLDGDGDGGAEPGVLHPVRLWRTPFTGEADERHAPPPPADGGPLARVGEAELVRAVAGALSLARMARETTGTDEAAYAALTASAERLTHAHPWLDADGLGGLAEPVGAVRAAAEAVLGEAARVRELRARAAAALDGVTSTATALVRRARGEQPADASGWTALLAALRTALGEAEALHGVRYVDEGEVRSLEAGLTSALEEAGRRAAVCLAAPDAFAGLRAALADLAGQAGEADTVAACAPLAEHVEEEATRLRTAAEVVTGLDLPDARLRAALLERMGEATGEVNRARAAVDARRRALAEDEQRAEFTAELALLGQAVSGALAASGTPADCDDHLAALLAQVENLTARFGAAGDAAEVLAARREEIEETFAARKAARLEERARHAQRLAATAERLLAAVARRCAGLDGPQAAAGFFAADPLVRQVRRLAGELEELDETVRADEVRGRLAAVRAEGLRTLRDRAELGGADGLVRLGRHRFAAGSDRAELTLVPGGDAGGLAFAVTGTDYREPLPEGALAGTEEFWDQPLVSESPLVYRAEHLAARVLAESGADTLGALSGPELLAHVTAAAEAAWDEGHDRGVHDHDAVRILAALLPLHGPAGLLRFPPAARAAATLLWAHGCDAPTRAAWTTRARSLARARDRFGRTPPEWDRLAGQLTDAVTEFAHRAGLPAPEPTTGEYLAAELAREETHFATGPGARRLLAALGEEAAKELAEDLHALGDDLAARHALATAWLAPLTGDEDDPDLPEAVSLALCAEDLPRREADVPLSATVTGLLGDHPRLRAGELPLRIDEFLARTAGFRAHRVPAHRAFTRRRRAVLAAERDRLALDGLRPRVLPSFVRNRLIDEVYLPLIGDNLAKQLGTADADRRTERSGLLLLLSPPGYGKTTLMEYVAARLGLLFVRVDGPALGHRTTSLDPDAAPDGAARRELLKIDTALRLGSNVLLHLDDVQHTGGELLQRFLPLCDAQRRLEGGTRAHDLRGKRFAVCMTGNPFTSTGARFRLPDMLANRADVWNLGEVLAGREELFALSHLENALTSHPVLAPLAARDRADLDLLVRLAQGDPGARPDHLAHPLPPAELRETVAVLERLLHLRRTVLAVNAAYIASAAQDDATRTEPPFLLQGSYRTSARLAERVLPTMDEDELEALLDDHYRAEAAVLASGAEANWLKLAQLRGRLEGEQAARWAEIREAFTAGRR